MEEPEMTPDQATRKRLLYIDDDPLARRSLTALLETWGYTVDAVEDAQDGLSKFAEEDYDLVITDMKMPRMDGWTVTEAIKNHNPDTPVVVISGSFAIDFKEPANTHQPDCILVKPLAFREFSVQLGRLLGRGESPDPD